MSSKGDWKGGSKRPLILPHYPDWLTWVESLFVALLRKDTRLRPTRNGRVVAQPLQLAKGGRR